MLEISFTTSKWLLLYLMLIPMAIFVTTVSSLASNMYATGPLMEIDRCASAWLIKRHVDPEATFRFYQEGALITEETAFDTPEAKFRRTHRSSTFEAIANHYDLKEEKVGQLAAIIHDIEINMWEKRNRYQQLLDEVNATLQQNATNEERLNACLHYFDAWKLQVDDN